VTGTDCEGEGGGGGGTQPHNFDNARVDEPGARVTTACAAAGLSRVGAMYLTLRRKSRLFAPVKGRDAQSYNHTRTTHTRTPHVRDANPMTVKVGIRACLRRCSPRQRAAAGNKTGSKVVNVVGCGEPGHVLWGH